MGNIKKCKGVGKALGHGCGSVLPYSQNNNIKTYKAKYGLGIDCKCYNVWLATSEEGKSILDKARISGKKKVEKEIKSKSREEKSINQDWSKKLQDEINKIVRTIDNGLTCLARNQRGQMHAGHVYARGGNSTIKYNLHNIHRQCAQSNHHQNDDGKLREGIVNEYGQKYMDFISGLRQTPTLQFNNIEYRELTIKAKKILKDLKAKDRIYSKSERIIMRNRVNIELSIYDTIFSEFKM